MSEQIVSEIRFATERQIPTSSHKQRAPRPGIKNNPNMNMGNLTPSDSLFACQKSTVMAQPAQNKIAVYKKNAMSAKKRKALCTFAGRWISRILGSLKC